MGSDRHKKTNSFFTARKMAAGKEQVASLNDLFGMMGGLMSAMAPPKDAAAIKEGMDELGLVMGGMFQGVVHEAVQSHQEIPTRVGKPIYEWLPLDDKTKLPEHALLVGKYHRKYQGLFVAHNGKEVEVWENIEILCVAKDAELKWEDVQDGVVPSGAVVGTIVDGKKEFVGRGILVDVICPGRIVPDDRCMYASYGGTEKVLKKYQALVIMNAKPLYRWVPVDNWVLPGNAISVTKDIFVGRASLLEKIRLVKVSKKDQKVLVAHSGKQEEITGPFEVLCPHEEAKF